MEYQHVQRVYKNPFYVNFKKHYCPNCKIKLRRIKVSKIVNSKSEEAKNFDFEFGNSFMIGNVKFVWIEFQCPMCMRRISIDKMMQIERMNGEME